MIRKTFAWLLVAGLAGAAVQAQTADEIIAKNIEARGGKDKIKAVQSIRMTGKIAMGQGMEAPILMEVARPEQAAHGVHHPGDDRRPGLRRQDRLVGDALHGQEGPRDDVGRRDQADRGPGATSTACWSTTRRRGTRSSTPARRTSRARRPHKLKVTKKNGDVVNVYIDAESVHGAQGVRQDQHPRARRSRTRSRSATSSRWRA